ncbi:MAG: thioredoxin domain-containing protein [Chloroflexi bacterium]|nr:thioredoxin domain-containing protein [Chloroflexota bacterium]
MPNHLTNENSPYLLQHANNPVDWYPWGPEALSRSHNEDKPIFLSIGYAACHWCHVMERESFEDDATATFMNTHFINIKVDREERPDLDSIYMSATVSMTGSGGWPMSVFLTPDLRPFYAGTYFPPEPRFNLPSFRDLLTSIANAWQEQRGEILRVSAQVSAHIQNLAAGNNGGSMPLTRTLLANAAEQLVKSYDWGFGGWGEAPKFPQPMTIEFLLCLGTLDSSSPALEVRQKYIQIASHALQAMARGGMYDLVGGGFARYSVDNLWKTPHFEKMLYDNAQLAQVYLHAYLVTGQVRFRQICEETLDFLLREMRHPAGGFFSSLDADSEGQEGKFYTWDFSELESILGPEFEFFQTAYGLAPAHKRQTGQTHDLEGKLIIQRALDDNKLAARFNLSLVAVNARLDGCHRMLLEIRNQRIRPGTDDKVLTSWNALALVAFAEAGRYLSRQDYVEAAAQNAHFLLDNLYADGQLLRSWRNNSARRPAYLDDYANLILALLALYQSQPETHWYTSALNLATEMVEHFKDPAGGFFDVRDDHQNILMRPKDVQDNATPSGNAQAANALLQLAEYGDRPEWRKIAEVMLGATLESAVRFPTAFAKWLCATDFCLGPTRQVAIVGAPQNPMTQTLVSALWQTYQPRQVVAIASDPAEQALPALLKNRPMFRGLPSAYVCHGFVCLQPVNTPDELIAQLDRTPNTG